MKRNVMKSCQGCRQTGENRHKDKWIMQVVRLADTLWVEDLERTVIYGFIYDILRKYIFFRA